VPDAIQSFAGGDGSSLLATAPTVKADQIGALLTGYEEVPSVSTWAAGEFTATIAPDETPSSIR
jgi:hypothetical protein